MNEQDMMNDEERIERIRDAAEDMLAALKGLAAAFVNPYDGSPFEVGEVPELDAARAAIAKAEGRSTPSDDPDVTTIRLWR